MDLITFFVIIYTFKQNHFSYIIITEFLIKPQSINTKKEVYYQNTKKLDNKI